MEPIQINVTIKLDEATQSFVKSLFGAFVPAPANPVPEAKKPTNPAAIAQTTAEQAAKAAAVVAEAAKNVQAGGQGQSAETISIDSLRELAMTKMNAHRAEIKEKLTELGAPSITKLDTTKYPEMYVYLKSLS